MSAPKIIDENTITLRGCRRTAEQNKRRNELKAQKTRDEFGGKMPSYIAGLSRAQSSDDARQRSDYLNGQIKAGKNFIR